MPLPDALALLDYWQEWPPPHEIMAILTRAMTTWKPEGVRPLTAEEHMRSLEERWAAGAPNAKQLFEAMGGTPIAPEAFPGVGPFPGSKTVH